MKLILSKKDLSRLSAHTRSEILDYLSSRAPEEERTVDDAPDKEYDDIYMEDVASLTYGQVRTWMEAASDWTKAGLRVFAEQGPIVHVEALVEALKEEEKKSGKDKVKGNYSQFQSRTTVRTRTVTGDPEAYLLGWDEWEGPADGRYAVKRRTYKSLRRYFRLDEEGAS